MRSRNVERRPEAESSVNAPAFVRHEQIVHVVGAFFFHSEDAVEHRARRRILGTKVVNPLAVVIDCDPFWVSLLSQSCFSITPLACW